MAISDADLWHQVHAEREDGIATMFLVRDIEPRPDQPQIFVIEMPYPITDLSKLPDAASYRRLDTFQEQWVEPACEALGWTLVASKSEDGSFFLYMYGAGDPNTLLEKLAPFDGALGFFSDEDADWSEYAALRELVDQAEAADDAQVHIESDEHRPDETSDGVPVGIPVIDLTGEPPARRASARATTVNLGKPLAADKAGGARPARPRPSATKAKAKAKARAATKGTSKRAAASKPPRAKAAKHKAVASKPATRKPSAPRSRTSKASPTKSPVRKPAAKRGVSKRR